jgi:hypothetical protein
LDERLGVVLVASDRIKQVGGGARSSMALA